MKTLTKITYIFSLVAIVAIGVAFTNTKTVLAQCTSSSTPGNLYGYITASNIPTEIYVSTESWNDDPLSNGHTPTATDFYINYDRGTGLWSGRAWDDTVGWVEFDTGTLDQQAFVEDAVANPENWGYWDGMSTLDEVNYSTNSGGFIGSGYSSDFTGNGGTGDSYVGLGELDFSNVSYVDSPCNENVNIFLNDTSNFHRDSCPISAPTIKWTSENVANCVTDDGFWTSPGSRSSQNTSGETASSGLSSQGSQLFRLKCVGDTTGADVYGSASLSCGSSGGGGGSGGGDPIDPDTIIVPIIIEA